MCQEKILRMAIFNKLDDLKFKITSPIICEIIGESFFNVGSNFLKVPVITNDADVNILRNSDRRSSFEYGSDHFLIRSSHI